MINPTGKGKVIHSAATLLKAGKQTGPGVGHEFELNGPPGLLLHHHGTSSNFGSDDQGANLDFHKIASPQFTVDREIKQGAIPQPALTIKKNPDFPDLTRF